MNKFPAERLSFFLEIAVGPFESAIVYLFNDINANIALQM